MSPFILTPAMSFARLPLEIRQQIYEYVLDGTPCEDTQLLQVCSRIYDEAQQYLFKRPLTFESQPDLIRWVQSVDPDNLEYVSTVRLRMLDMAPDEVIRVLGNQLKRAKVDSRPGTPQTGPYEEACDRQIQSLERALKLLPNVQDFTMLRPKSCERAPCQYMQLALLQLVVRMYPRLRRLTLHPTNTSMMPLRFLQNLRSLRFCGWSTSTPQEMANIFRKLPSLQEIEVSGPPRGLAFEQRPGYKGPLRMQSFTSNVLKAMHPLKSFTIHDLQDDPYDTTTEFLTDDFYDALALHHASLRTLRINASDLPWKRFDRFAKFLSRSSLTHLECNWLNPDSALVAALPGSLVTLRINIPQEVAEAWADGIFERRGDLSALRQVTVQTDSDVEPKRLARLVRSSRRLAVNGIRFVPEMN